jgi:hypothetical protein
MPGGAHLRNRDLARTLAEPSRITNFVHRQKRSLRERKAVALDVPVIVATAGRERTKLLRVEHSRQLLTIRARTPQCQPQGSGCSRWRSIMTRRLSRPKSFTQQSKYKPPNLSRLLMALWNLSPAVRAARAARRGSGCRGRQAHAAAFECREHARSGSDCALLPDRHRPRLRRVRSRGPKDRRSALALRCTVCPRS